MVNNRTRDIRTADMTSDQKIDRILGFEPGRERELPQIFIVGEKHGLSGLVVTSIEYGVTNYGDHGIGWYYVKSFDTVIAEMAVRAVAEIHYAVPRPAAA
jgi:hypothetical protein